MSSQVDKDAKSVGWALAEVLARRKKYWFQQAHLLRLNLLLLISLLSSSVSGYDGMFRRGILDTGPKQYLIKCSLKPHV